MTIFPMRRHGFLLLLCVTPPIWKAQHAHGIGRGRSLPDRMDISESLVWTLIFSQLVEFLHDGNAQIRQIGKLNDLFCDFWSTEQKAMFGRGCGLGCAVVCRVHANTYYSLRAFGWTLLRTRHLQTASTPTSPRSETPRQGLSCEWNTKYCEASLR
jgi:hypothetical protein